MFTAVLWMVFMMSSQIVAKTDTAEGCKLLHYLPNLGMQKNTLVMSHTETLFGPHAVGNYLTLYYNARNLAKFLGICFRNQRHFTKADQWLVHLPEGYCPPPPNYHDNITLVLNHLKESADTLSNLCKLCGTQGFAYQFPHECKTFWFQDLPGIKTEIRAALETFALEHKTPIAKYDDEKTSVIYSRCKVRVVGYAMLQRDARICPISLITAAPFIKLTSSFPLPLRRVTPSWVTERMAQRASPTTCRPSPRATRS